MILSDERFDALLDGDEPRDEIERQWITNYRKEQNEISKRFEEEDQKRLQKRQQGYREYYALLMSILPKSFLYKEPFSVDEIESIASKIMEDADNKMWNIFLNPVLRKLNGLPLKRSPFPDDEKPYMTKVTNNFIQKAFKKQYNVDIKALEKKYYSFFTKESIAKVEEIEKKYDIILTCEFDICDYLSNWERYNV